MVECDFSKWIEIKSYTLEMLKNKPTDLFKEAKVAKFEALFPSTRQMHK